MSGEPPIKKPRKPNPKCAECDHPVSFHPRDQKTHRRKCKAFGCHCKNYAKPKATEAAIA